MLKRKIAAQISRDLENLRKIFLIFGARQVGKTTLIRKIIKGLPYRTLEVNGDERRHLEILSSRDFEKIMGLVGAAELLFIDEAQNIPEIGINLKILYDRHPSLKIIATGSSSFDLVQKTVEPLTGRTRTWKLFPISFQELSEVMTPFELENQIENSMIFGMYPEILTAGSSTEKKRNLRELSKSYLYRDVLELSSIRRPDKLNTLLRMLANQIGEFLSVNKIADELGISHEAVSNYLDMLEKSYIIFRLPGWSDNPKVEISKMKKIYFYDLGIRNMLIENFSSVSIRGDRDKLWENFLLIERMKKKTAQDNFYQPYFWKTYAGTTIDFVEFEDAQLNGFDFRWKKRKRNAPKSWTEKYPQGTFKQIHKGNFLDFIL